MVMIAVGLWWAINQHKRVAINIFSALECRSTQDVVRGRCKYSNSSMFTWSYTEIKRRRTRRGSAQMNILKVYRGQEFSHGLFF